MLEVKNIYKKYKTKNGVEVNALNGVSLKFPQKGMVFVLGKSGSGKSTLLNVLGGLDKIDSGEILVKGSVTDSFKQRDFDSYRNTYIGFIFQEYNLLEEFTVGANIALAIELQGRVPQEGEINSILEKVDLTGLANRKPNELSGGQKQRVAIARALVKNPEIIMADEPTGALDSNTGKQIFDLLKELSKEKLVLIVSHDREFSEKYADRIIELADGNVISDEEVNQQEEESAGEAEDLTFDNNEIFVKKGYKLTPEDLIKINEYMDKVNETLSLMPLKERNKTQIRIQRGFVPTREDLIEMSSEGYKLIKSKLSLKNAFKIALTTLKHKKFRLIVTIFLSVISFTLFGLSSVMSFMNRTSVETNSLMDEKISYAAFKKEVLNSADKNDKSYTSGRFTDDDITFIEEKTGLKIKPIVSLNSTLRYSSYYGEHPSSYTGYASSSSGVVNFSQDDLNEFGYSLVYGKLPQNEGEICITSYVYDSLKHFGYKNYYKDGAYVTETSTINNYADVIGTSIYTDQRMEIVGIIDTCFNYSSYLSLDENSEKSSSDLSDIILAMEISYVNSSSLHTALFVYPDEYDSYVGSSSRYLSATDNGYNGIYYDTDKNSYLSSFLWTMKEEDVIYRDFFDKDKTSLGSNEYLVSPDIFSSLMQYIVNDTRTDYNPNYINDAMPYYEGTDDYSYGNDILSLGCEIIQMSVSNAASEYVKLNSDKIHADTDTVKFGDSSYNDGEMISKYYDYLIDQYYGEGKFTDEEKTLINKYVRDISSAIIKTVCGDYLPLISVGDYGDDIAAKGFICGIAVDFTSSNGDLIVGDAEFIAKFHNQSVSGKYDTVVANMPSSYNGIRKVVKFSSKDFSGVKYTLTNGVSYQVELVASVFKILQKVFFWIAMFFALFASILLSTFIASSVAYKKRDIGVLRAIGSRSNDVFRIFFSEAFIIAMINYVLALILTAVLCVSVNKTVRSSSGIKISFLNIGFEQFLILFAVSVGVAFIATYLPVLRIASKKPVDAIRNK